MFHKMLALRWPVSRINHHLLLLSYCMCCLYVSVILCRNNQKKEVPQQTNATTTNYQHITTTDYANPITNKVLQSDSIEEIMMQKDENQESILNRERLKKQHNQQLQEQEDLIELKRYFLTQDNGGNGGKLSLPAPENVTVILLSWYPPIIKLNWCITELDGHQQTPVIDIRKHTFVNNKVNQTLTQSLAQATAATNGRQHDDVIVDLDDDDEDDANNVSYNDDDVDDNATEQTGDNSDHQTTTMSTKNFPFIMNIVSSSTTTTTTTTTTDKNDNNTGDTTNSNIQHLYHDNYNENNQITTDTNKQKPTNPTDLNTKTTNINYGMYEPGTLSGSSRQQLTTKSRSTAKRRIQILKKTLMAFEVTYNAVDSRYKTVEEYPPYLRSITLERLAPATKYELRVSALYLGGNRNISQRVHFISPSDNESRRFRENSYRPIHRYPDELPTYSKIRGEEITIVVFVIIFWIGTVFLFINKWGKIRMLEPYQPAYREAPLFHHSSIHGVPTKGMSFCGGVASTTGVVGATVPCTGGISAGPAGSLTTSGPIFYTTTGQANLPPVRASSQAGPDRSGVGYDLSTIGKQNSTGGYSGLRAHHHPVSLFATKAHAIAKASSVLDQSHWRYAASRHRVPSIVGSGTERQTQRPRKSICASTSPTRMCSIDAGCFHKLPTKPNFKQQRMVKMGSSTTSGQSIEQHQLDLSQNRQRRLLYLSQRDRGSGCNDSYKHHYHQGQSPNESRSSISIPSMPPTRANSDEKNEKNPHSTSQRHNILIEPPSPPKVITGSTLSTNTSADQQLNANQESSNRGYTNSNDHTPEPFTISKSGPSTTFSIDLDKSRQGLDDPNVPKYYSSNINLQHHHQSNVSSSHHHYQKHRPYIPSSEQNQRYQHHHHPHHHQHRHSQQQQYCSHQQLPYLHHLVQQQQQSMIVEQQNDDILQHDSTPPRLIEANDDAELCDRGNEVYSADCAGCDQQLRNYADELCDQSMSDGSRLKPANIRHDTQSLSTVSFYQQQQHDQSLLLDTNDAYLTSGGGACRPRLSSVFVASPYARAHRDSFAMLRAISQKKSKSAEDVACLSSLVLQIWAKDRNPLLQQASASTNNTSKDTDNDQGSCSVLRAAKRRRPRSSLTVAHL